MFAIVAVKSETEAVLVVVEMIISSFEAVISALNMIIFASQTIMSGSETIWFECHMIISVTEIIFFAPDMVICGRNKMNSRPMTMSLLPEKLALSRNRLLFSGPLTVSIR